MTVYPSQGNFVFVKLPGGMDGIWVRDQLQFHHGVMVRECGNKLGSNSQFMRLAVRPQPDVQRLLAGLSTVLYGTSFYAPQIGWGQQAPTYSAPQQQPLAHPYQQPPQLPVASFAQEPQPLYPAYALTAPQGVPDPYGQSAAYTQQQPASLAPAYVATPPPQTSSYQAPTPQAQQFQAAQLQHFQQPQGQTPSYQAPLMQTAPAQGAASQTVQAQAQQGQAFPTQAPAAAYTWQQPDEQTYPDRRPFYSQDAAEQKTSPLDQTQTIVYDPAVLRTSGDPDNGLTDLTPALQRYPRPAAYLQSDAMS